MIASTPVSNTNEPKRDEPEVCLEDELGELNANEEEERLGVVEEKQEAAGRQKDCEEEEDVAEDDCMGLEMRNTDSVFSELSELSRHYLESVDQGASVRGDCIHMTSLHLT